VSLHWHLSTFERTEHQLASNERSCQWNTSLTYNLSEEESNLEIAKAIKQFWSWKSAVIQVCKLRNSYWIIIWSSSSRSPSTRGRSQMVLSFATNIWIVSTEIQMDITYLKYETHLRRTFRQAGLLDFYKKSIYFLIIFRCLAVTRHEWQVMSKHIKLVKYYFLNESFARKSRSRPDHRR
jgi:hypothetical protein